MNAATASECHPHEPTIPPVLDAEGRCIVCGLLSALEPFADPRSWHHNYDGSGVIFQPDGAFYPSEYERPVEAAKLLWKRLRDLGAVS